MSLFVDPMDNDNVTIYCPTWYTSKLMLLEHETLTPEAKSFIDKAFKEFNLTNEGTYNVVGRECLNDKRLIIAIHTPTYGMIISNVERCKP